MVKTRGLLDRAYGLQSKDDNQKLYSDWAESYDETFAADMDYELPILIAAQYWHHKGEGPVLDVGAGTGLVGEMLERLGIAPADGLDLSPEMLGVAMSKGVYARVMVGDLLDRLPIEDNAYAGAVSAGTFTRGHVGPEGLDEVIRVVRPGGLICISVEMAHWEDQEFGAALLDRQSRIDIVAAKEVTIYGPDASGPHANDLANLVTLAVR